MDLDRALVLLDGGVELPDVGQREGQRASRVDAIRVELNGLVGGFERLAGPPGVIIGQRQEGARLRVIRRELGRVQSGADRFFGAAIRDERQAQQGVGLGVVRRDFHRPLRYVQRFFGVIEEAAPRVIAVDQHAPVLEQDVDVVGLLERRLAVVGNRGFEVSGEVGALAQLRAGNSVERGRGVGAHPARTQRCTVLKRISTPTASSIVTVQITSSRRLPRRRRWRRSAGWICRAGCTWRALKCRVSRSPENKRPASAAWHPQCKLLAVGN